MSQGSFQGNFYRTWQHRVLTGVCSGLSERFHIDLLLVRLVTIVLGFLGVGIIAYIVLSISLPSEPVVLDEVGRPAYRRGTDIIQAFGLLIVSIFVPVLVYRLGGWPFVQEAWGWVWPVSLMILGFFIILGPAAIAPVSWKRFLSNSQWTDDVTRLGKLRLRRTRRDRMIYGVCSGIAGFIKADTFMIRLIALLLVILLYGIPIPVYLLLAILIPEEE